MKLTSHFHSSWPKNLRGFTSASTYLYCMMLKHRDTFVGYLAFCKMGMCGEKQILNGVMK